MIQLLIQALRDSGIDPGFFRLAESLTFRTLMGLTTALALAVMLGERTISFLYRRRFRDTSGEHISIGVHSKRGTPTGGGLLILFSTTISAMLWADLTSPFIWPLLLGFVYLGCVGFVDDFLKVRFKSSLVGLSQLAKTFLQLLFALPFALYFVSPLCPLPDELKTVIQIPFYKYPLFDAGTTAFVVFTVFVLFSIVNAVNITDGMDGLLGGTSILTTVVYLVFAYVIGNSELSSYLLFSYVPGTGEVAVFGAMLIGAVLGFLWFNTYPAQVFMGDTGSLAIGGALGMMAFFTKQEILFVLVGGIFVAEIFTSLVQEKIGYSLGRRLLYRAPLHHALTHRGVAEPKVVLRLWITAMVLAMVGLLSLKIR